MRSGRGFLAVSVSVLAFLTVALLSLPPLSVRAAGPRAAASVSMAALADDLEPPVTVLSPDDGLWHQRSAFALSVTDASDIAATTWVVDGEQIAVSPGAPLLPSSVDQGSHSVEYWSSDVAGNVEPPHSSVIKIDDTPPASTVAGNDTEWHNTDVTLSFAAIDAFSDVAMIESRLDGGSWDAGPSRTVLAPMDHANDGVRTVEYRAVDTAGNIEDANSVPVKIDTAPPVTTQTGADSTWHNNDVTVTLDASDADSGVATTEYRVGAGDWTTGTSVVVAAPADHSNDGLHTIAYRSTDLAGNAETAKSATVRIDTTAPVTSDSSDTAWHRSTFMLVLTPGADASGVTKTEYRIDGGSWTSGDTLTIANDGVHTVTYRSTDAAGNVEADRSCQVKIDGTAPVTQQSGADGAWHKTPVTVAFSADDGASGVARTEYRVDGAASWTSGDSVVVSKHGVHTVAYRSADRADNVEESHSVQVKIDTSAPVTFDDAPTRWRNATVTVTLQASDIGSGLSSGLAGTEYSVLFGGVQGPWQNGRTIVIPADPTGHVGDGRHTITYRTTDAAGNTEADKTCAVRIDTQRPKPRTPVAKSVRRGSWVSLPYSIADARPGSPTATVTIRIKTLGGSTVKQVLLRDRKVNTSLAYRFRCTLAKKTYKFWVYARDAAGNTQLKAASNRLTVR